MATRKGRRRYLIEYAIEAAGQPRPITCARCGSTATLFPGPSQETAPKKDAAAFNAWQEATRLVICPHCTPLPSEKWPEWWHGKLAKACGCGQAACPVPAYAASKG